MAVWDQVTTTGESDQSPNREVDASLRRLSRLAIFGGVFYLLVAGGGLFFVGSYISRGSPGPLWVPVLGLLIGGGTLAMGAWMIRAGLRGTSKASETWLRRLASGAVAALLLAPLEILDVVQGPVEFVIATAGFFVTDSLLKRWIGRTTPRQVEAGRPDELGSG